MNTASPVSGRRRRWKGVLWTFLAAVLLSWLASRFGAVARGGALVRERAVTLTGKPCFVWDAGNGCPEAWVDTDPLKRKFTWPQREFPAGVIAPDSRLSFTFFEPTFLSTDPLTLVKVSSGNRTLYDASICPVHLEKMHRMAVKIEDGLSSSIEQTLFPYGGHISRYHGSGETTTWVCDSCARERDRWLDKCHNVASASR